MDLSIESIRPGDEEQRHDLRRQAFGMTDPFDADMPTPDLERTVAAYDGERLLATVVTLDFGMSWSGSLVPCGGVSGVVVRPEARGRGLARALMTESLRRMGHRGEVLSALYPTTATLYRSVGYEVGGSFDWRRVPLHLVPTEPADSLTWRRVAFDDPAIAATYSAMVPTVDGWIEPDEVWWRRTRRLMTKDTSKNRYAYVGSRRAQDVAALVYRYDSSDDRLYELAVETIAGADGAAVAAALAFLARNGTTAGHLETTLPAQVLALHVPNVQLTSVTNDWPWMIRLVNVAGAFAARPWPRSVSGRIELDIADEACPANAGRHVLEFDRGVAAVTPGGSGTVAVRVSDLAAVYSGADPGLLRGAGRLDRATGEDLDVLAAACAGSPSMAFFF